MEAQDCSSHCSGIRPHLALRGESNFFFFSELLQEALGSSQVAMGTSGNLSCFLGEVRSAFKLQGAPRDSSLVTAGEEGLISS